jgi:hypothetical protein
VELDPEALFFATSMGNSWIDLVSDGAVDLSGENEVGLLGVPVGSTSTVGDRSGLEEARYCCGLENC